VENISKEIWKEYAGLKSVMWIKYGNYILLVLYFEIFLTIN
jgi:hypothetical protein